MVTRFSSFVELLIKQTCRRASHEFEKCKHSSDDPSGIYSLEFLKLLHDRPPEYLVKLLKIATKNQSTIKVSSGPNWLNCEDFSKVERKILLDFLSKVKDMAPSNAQKWIDLQHYLHYIYRNFASANPDPTGEEISSFFINCMRDLVKSLLKEDESQLYLRILALLREYCIFAQWNYSKYQGEQSITRMFYYYEAMLSAAKHLSSVFSEFEIVIYKNYTVCWIDFNTSVFIRYFFHTDFVQNKIHRSLETRLSPGDTAPMFSLLEDLKNLWIKEEARIQKINDDAAIKETVDYYYIEEAMINSHKKVLTSNFWVERPQQDKDDLDLRRLDHHIFRLLSDRLFHPAGPILDRTGQCICEECMLAKFECMLDAEGDSAVDKLLNNVSRLCFCQMCKRLVNLELFHQHINSHKAEKSYAKGSKNLSRIDSEKCKIKKGSSDIFDDVSRPRKPCNIHYTKLNGDGDCADCDDMSRLELENFLLKKKEVKPLDLCSLNNSVRTYLRIKQGLYKQNDKLMKANQPKTHTECDRKHREMRKNAHKHEKPYSSTYKNSVTTKLNNCEHTYEAEEETNSDTRETRELCDYHKRCDCTFCDVFGTSVTSHSHKNNELRDRLRIRLHQRREKRIKDTGKPAPVVNTTENVPTTNPSVNLNNNVKKTVINKVEERVPLPSSPTNIPPAPIVKSSESSVTSSCTDDIHGLVSYIEGNSGLNKMELAQKKAAKKARQRQKKEEERIKLEEQKKLSEKQRKKEAKDKKLGEIEKQVRDNLGGKEHKNGKKENQGEKKKQNMNFVEQTIPAMVTIKRIAENGCNPTVTITLKGSTPDQDKLLYALVKEAGGDNGIKEVKEMQNGNNAISNKKKKQKQKNKIIEADKSPKVVTKELQVTVALEDNDNYYDSKKNKNLKNIDKIPMANINNNNNNHQKQFGRELKPEELPFPEVRLPPGITITKVEGPIVSSHAYEVNSNLNLETQSGPAINVKSGVIVVDTEKLIQSKQSVEQKSAISKKSKRKKIKNK